MDHVHFDGSWWILMDLNGSWWILYNLYNSTLPWTPWLFASRVVFLARLSRCQCSRWWRLRDRSFWSVWPWKWLKFMAVVGKSMANIYGSLWISMDFYVHGCMMLYVYMWIPHMDMTWFNVIMKFLWMYDCNGEWECLMIYFHGLCIRFSFFMNLTDVQWGNGCGYTGKYAEIIM